MRKPIGGSARRTYHIVGILTSPLIIQMLVKCKIKCICEAAVHSFKRWCKCPFNLNNYRLILVHIACTQSHLFTNILSYQLGLEFNIHYYLLFMYLTSKSSDDTAEMRRLIWVLVHAIFTGSIICCWHLLSHMSPVFVFANTLLI